VADLARGGDPLSVALAMLTLVPGGMGGSETYARALTRELATSAAVGVTAFVPREASGFSEGVGEQIVPAVRGGATTRDRLRSVAMASLRARSIRTLMSAADVVHYPFTVQAPRAAKRQAVVQSLLDVQHLDLPELFSRAELLYRRHFYEGGARRADVVITISEFAKRRMIELLGLPGEKIRVAHLGVDTASFTPNLGARQNFVLYPARGWAHKNHARLVEAMRIVRTSIPDIRLVLTGGGLDTLGALPDWVDRRGLVSTSELRELYHSAAALAFPSLYEGFGLPPLEAMASGCPAAVADVGSIPEVVGDAAVLFDPLDPDSIAQGICSAIERREELSAAGLLQASRFTWESCRDVHVEAYVYARDVH
jgi:glycosyltransferase involved in cell wall biosynthesis